MIINGSISGVAGNSEITVLSYTNTSGAVLYVRGIGLEGNSESDWTIYKNLAPILKKRLTASETADGTKMYDLKLENNDILTIKVIHHESFLAEFSADAIITDTKESDAIVLFRFTNYEINLIAKIENQKSALSIFSNELVINSIVNQEIKKFAILKNEKCLFSFVENEKKLIATMDCE